MPAFCFTTPIAFLSNTGSLIPYTFAMASYRSLPPRSSLGAASPFSAVALHIFSLSGFGLLSTGTTGGLLGFIGVGVGAGVSGSIDWFTFSLCIFAADANVLASSRWVILVELSDRASCEAVTNSSFDKPHLLNIVYANTWFSLLPSSDA